MKKVGIIKRIFALLLIFLLSINSFGAVVSDNDGSAFITKAEFDSLKNNFQSQIDSYNQSIDSKIDGAIAAYLAGIRLQKTTNEATLFDLTGGIYAVVPDTFDGTTGKYSPQGLAWTRGNMGFKWSGQLNYPPVKSLMVGTTSVHQFASFIVTVNRTPSNFKERMVQSYNTTTGEACWVGYCQTQQMVSGSVNETHPVTGNVKHPKLVFGGNSWAAITDPGSGTEDDPYNCVTGFILYNMRSNNHTGLFDQIPADRTPLTDKDSVFYHECFREAVSSGAWGDRTAKLNTSTVDSSGVQQLDFKAKGTTFTRNIISKANEMVIVCNNDTKYEAYRFSDNDLISGWNTESDDRFTTGISSPGKSHDSMLPSGSVKVSAIGLPSYYSSANSSPIYLDNGQVFQGYLTTSDTSLSYFKIKTVMRTSANPSFGSTTWYENQPAYFGLMPTTELDDWRKLYTDKYNAVLPVSELKAAQKEGADTVYTNTAGTHLMLGAGLPVIKLEKNCKYTLTLQADSSSLTGETGDYYLWLKLGTFTKDKRPENESNLFAIDGLTKDSTGYILPVGTSKSVTIEANDDGYLFCKWRNMNLDGGGNLKIERVVTKTTDQ